MNKETHKALLASIVHWECNTTAPMDEVKIGTDDCALCKKFNYDYRTDMKPGCTNCPVMEKTGGNLCKNSPYDKCSIEYRGWRSFCNSSRERWNATRRFRRAAWKEVEFLRSLLPKEKALSPPSKDS